MEKTTFAQPRDDRLTIGVMFTKVDRENRTVSGFATLDNRDDHGDIVSAEGSRSAFKRFRGGLREMHLPNAVGTLVSFKEMKKYDRNSDRVYDGIYVSAKVSKGAKDTWEKVLDGTLKGFSIGGKIKRKSKSYDDDGVEQSIIDDYDLIELSLVDNPANPLASVLTVQKVNDQYVYTDAIEKQVMNILLHEESGDVVLSEDADSDEFVNIGWTDSPDNTEKIRAALDAYERRDEDTEKSLDTETDDSVLLNEDEGVILDGVDENTDEGGATVATDTNEKDDVKEEQVEKSADTDEVTDATDTTDESTEDDAVEKAADVREVEEDDPADEITKAVQAAVTDAIAKATGAAEESRDAATSVKDDLTKALDDFKAEISSLRSEVKKDVDGLAKRVEDVESDTAVKKSADVVEDDDAEEDDEEDSFWRGSGFLSANDLVKG